MLCAVLCCAEKHQYTRRALCARLSPRISDATSEVIVTNAEKHL